MEKEKTLLEVKKLTTIIEMVGELSYGVRILSLYRRKKAAEHKIT